MSTTIRPEISEKNPYWIDKHRFYELKHFCLQYPIWKKAYASIDNLARKQSDIFINRTNSISDPVQKCVEQRMYYAERIEMIEKAAKDASDEFSSYILKAVTEGYSYNYLKTVLNMPCCKETYYEVYRRFFWLLNKTRK